MSNKAIEQYILICHHLFARLLIASTQVHAAAFLAAAVGVEFLEKCGSLAGSCHFSCASTFKMGIFCSAVGRKKKAQAGKKMDICTY